MTDDAADSLFDALLTQQRLRGLPPVDQWQPEHEGAIDIRIARDGTWYHQGGAIKREAMVRLFSTILRREGDAHFLVTPAEKLAIDVEDSPFTAIRLEQEGEGRAQRLLLTTNVGDHVLVDAEHPLTVIGTDANGDPAPRVQVRGGMQALLSRPVYYELAELAESDPEDPDQFGVYSCGRFFPLGEKRA